MKGRSNKWKRMICPNSDYTIFSQAVRHKGNRGHVNRVRHLDREPAPISSPLRATSETESESGHGRSPSGSRSPPIRDPVDEFPDLFGGRPSLHGPALPSDNPDQIYDDFSGELARNRPSPESSDQSFGSSSDSEGYDDYLDTSRDPPSDGTIPWELPESDGLMSMTVNLLMNKDASLICLFCTYPHDFLHSSCPTYLTGSFWR